VILFSQHLTYRGAAQNQDVEMIHIFLYGGADLTLKSNDGKTPFNLLAMNAGDEKTIIILREGITKHFKLKRE